MYRYGCFDPDHACLAEDDGSDEEDRHVPPQKGFAQSKMSIDLKEELQDREIRERFKTERQECLRPDEGGR